MCDEQDNAVLSTKLVYLNKGQARLPFIIIIFIFFFTYLSWSYIIAIISTIKSKSEYAMFL